MAGVVVKGRFPRRRIVAIVASNVFRSIFERAARSWLRNASSTAPALGSMTLLLLLSGLVGLSAFAVQRLATTQANDAAVLHIYLRDDARQADVDALRSRLTGDHRVASVNYTSKSAALQLAQHRPGMNDLAGAAEDNPFPASLDVRLRNVGDVGPLAGSVTSNAAVDPILQTSYDPGANQRIQRVLLIMGIIGGTFLLLLGFVAVAVTANSIRAAILARQHEVAIMQLVGAPRWMVRGPFLVEGAVTGGIAGLAAGLVTLLVGGAVVAAGHSTFAQIAPGMDLGVCLVAAGGVFLVGLVLGSAASLVSVHRQLEV